MMLKVTLAVSQNVRGGCTNINCYYNITGWNDDRDPNSASRTIEVDKAVTKFQCGVGANLARTKTAGATFTINVYKNGSTTPTTTVTDANYGGGNEFAVDAPVSVAGDACKVVIAVTPTATLGTGCATTPWTYTWNINYVTGCISPNPLPYYRISDGSWWVTKPTTSKTIDLDLAVGNTIILGIDPKISGASPTTWSDGKGFTGTGETTYDPGFTAPGQSATVTGVYTDVCGKKSTYVYNLTVPLVCKPVDAPVFLYNNGNPFVTVNPAKIDVVDGVNTITVPGVLVGKTVQVGIRKNGNNTTSVAWSDSTGFTSVATDFAYDPGFTADNQTKTLTAVYTDNCGTATTYVYKFSSTTVCVPSTAPVRFYFNDNNGSNWVDPAPVTLEGTVNTITIAPIPLSGTVAVGLHLNGGDSVSYDDGLGFTATGGGDKTYSPGFTTAGETRTLTATYIDACGTSTIYVYKISSTGDCKPGAPTFFYNDNSGTGWHDDGSIVLASSPLTIPPVQLTGTVTIGVNLKGGSITWTDDNGLTPVPSTGTGKFQFTYNPGFTAGGQTRTLTGAYLDTCGNATNFVFSISANTVCVPNVPRFYYNNGSGWIDPATVAVDNSITVPAVYTSATFAPKIQLGVDLKGGSITWTDNNGMTAVPSTGTGKFQFSYDPLFTDGGQTRTVTGAYVDTCGKTTNYVYNISSTSTCVSIAPIPNYNINGAWKNNLTTSNTSIDINLNIGESTVLEIKPGNGDSNGTFSWTDTIGVYTDQASGQVSYTAPDLTFDVTGVYTDKCGTVTTYVFHIKSIGLGTNKFTKGGFKVYPNPTDRELNIVFNGDLKVSVVNASGQQVLSPRSISKQGTIDVSNLSQGLYFLKATANGESTVKKFIKK